MTQPKDQFFRDCWYVAGWDYEFEAGKLAQRIMLDQPLVVFRTNAGKLSVLEDRCVHRLAPLSMGRVEGDDLRCMYHGLKFNADGRCVEIPGQEAIPAKASVRAYPVVERGSWVWVWMGDPAKADPALIPRARGLDDPEWVLCTGQMDYAAPNHLINDNLLDLSHVAYIHANSFGADLTWSTSIPKVTPLARGVRITRWMESALPVPPLPSLTALGTVDMWQDYEFLTPGIFLMYMAVYPAGTARSIDGREPTDKPLFTNFTSQAVTPMTAEASRYFFSWGPGAGYGDKALAQIMVDVAHQAFMEDKVMIEAQAKVIARDPDREMMATSLDRTVITYQRVIERLQAEQS